MGAAPNRTAGPVEKLVRHLPIYMFSYSRQLKTADASKNSSVTRPSQDTLTAGRMSLVAASTPFPRGTGRRQLRCKTASVDHLCDCNRSIFVMSSRNPMGSPTPLTRLHTGGVRRLSQGDPLPVIGETVDDNLR